MAPPKKDVQTATVSFRMSVTAVKKLKAHCATKNMSVSDWLRMKIGPTFGDEITVSKTTPPSAGEKAAPKKPSEEPKSVDGCRHTWENRGYATFCSTCGERRQR